MSKKTKKTQDGGCKGKACVHYSVCGMYGEYASERGKEYWCAGCKTYEELLIKTLLTKCVKTSKPVKPVSGSK